MRLRSMSWGFLIAGTLTAAGVVGCAKGATLTPSGGNGGDGSDGGSGGVGGSGGIMSHTTGQGAQGGGTTTTTTTTTTTSSSSSSSQSSSSSSSSQSSSSSSSQSSSSSSGQGGGSSVCDGTGDCATCADCAGADVSLCFFEYFICTSDFECLDFSDCLSFCAQGDDVCVDGCITAYPTGAQEYSDYATCVVCGACYSDCDGAGSGC